MGFEDTFVILGHSLLYAIAKGNRWSEMFIENRFLAILMICSDAVNVIFSLIETHLFTIIRNGNQYCEQAMAVADGGRMLHQIFINN